MDPVLDGQFGGRKMGAVGGHDDDEVDLISARGFFSEHLLEGPVKARFVDTPRFAGGQGVLIRLGEAAGRQPGLPVHPDRLAVDIADEGARAASDHAVGKGGCLSERLLAFDHLQTSLPGLQLAGAIPKPQKQYSRYIMETMTKQDVPRSG